MKHTNVCKTWCANYGTDLMHHSDLDEVVLIGEMIATFSNTECEGNILYTNHSNLKYVTVVINSNKYITSLKVPDKTNHNAIILL